MDIRKVLSKLKYEKWEDNKIEHFYLWRLRWAYFTMRKNLSKLYFQGTDFFRIPLHNNGEFFKDIKCLLDNEVICENLFGNQLKRDQMNFIFDVLKIIMECPEQIKQKL